MFALTASAHQILSLQRAQMMELFVSGTSFAAMKRGYYVVSTFFFVPLSVKLRGRGDCFILNNTKFLFC